MLLTGSKRLVFPTPVGMISASLQNNLTKIEQPPHYRSSPISSELFGFDHLFWVGVGAPEGEELVLVRCSSMSQNSCSTLSVHFCFPRSSRMSTSARFQRRSHSRALASNRGLAYRRIRLCCADPAWASAARGRPALSLHAR